MLTVQHSSNKCWTLVGCALSVHLWSSYSRCILKPSVNCHRNSNPNLHLPVEWWRCSLFSGSHISNCPRRYSRFCCLRIKLGLKNTLMSLILDRAAMAWNWRHSILWENLKLLAEVTSNICWLSVVLQCTVFVSVYDDFLGEWIMFNCLFCIYSMSFVLKSLLQKRSLSVKYMVTLLFVCSWKG